MLTQTDDESLREQAKEEAHTRADEVLKKEDDRDGDEIQYLKGLQLVSIITALCICLFLTNLEIPIVTTALVGITNELNGFNESSWVISSYLLGYVGVLIIFAKLSDIFGRKLLLLISISLFGVFSAACGAAQTITQLIVFRALQGLGGGGNFALSTIMFLELVPPEEYAATTSFLSIVYCLSLLVGPILGGAISKLTTWRWVFLLNIPPAVIAAIVIIVALPNNFPHHGKPRSEKHKTTAIFSKASLRRVDFLGAAMLLTATLLFVAALEEAGAKYPWKSAYVISLLTLSGILWLLFLVWERKVTLTATTQEPVFPWRFVQSRVWVGMLLNALFLGAPWFVSIFQLPQKLQVVNSVSPLRAGILLMPFTFAAPVGSVVSAIVAKKARIPPIYIVIFASTLQVIGFALLSTLPATTKLVARQYGYEIIAGFGCGINISLLVLMVPFSVKSLDKAVAMGSITQFRIMGGAIGIAIATTLLNGLLRSRLSDFLSQPQVDILLLSAKSVSSFPPTTQLMIRKAFAEGFNLQMKVLAGFAAAQIPSSFLMWQKKQITV